VKKIIVTLAILGAYFGWGCGANSANVKAAATEAFARAAVTQAQVAWSSAAEACLAYAEEAQIDPILAPCAAPLRKAHNLIVVAADAADASWTSNSACNLTQGAVYVRDVIKSLQLKDTSALAKVEDVVTLAQALTDVACVISTPDAGAYPAPTPPPDAGVVLKGGLDI
jgi:hypothetical protein